MKFKKQFQKLSSVDCADDGQMMHHRFKSLAVRIVCIVFFSNFYTKGTSGNPASRVFSSKGVKDLSDRVFRSVIASKPSEEIRDKNLTIQKPSKMHTLQ